MAFSNMEYTGFRYIREIQESLNQKDYTSMTDKIIEMTKYLFTNDDLIYSELNDEFERSGLMQSLFESIGSLNEQSIRHNLRLLNIFLRTNNNLRNQACNSTKCIEFLLKNLDSREKWNYVENIKYHVNLTSYLLLTKNVQENIESIRGIVGQILQESKNDKNLHRRIIHMMFYSSAERNACLDKTIPQENNDCIMSKEVLSIFGDLIRDYICDFKVFYDDPTSEKNKYSRYILKAIYSFDQLCQCLIYYAQTNAKVRSNIFQSGIYDLLSLIFLIKSIPENFLLNAIEVFEIPCLDALLKDRFRQEHSVIIDRLKSLQLHESNLIKKNLVKLLNKYEKTEMLINLRNTRSKYSSNETCNWNSLNVDQWLSENNLESCRKSMSSLTGRGLNHLKSLMKDTNGKFHLIELLISKLNIDLISAIEFLGALESLNN